MGDDEDLSRKERKERKGGRIIITPSRGERGGQTEMSKLQKRAMDGRCVGADWRLLPRRD